MVESDKHTQLKLRNRTYKLLYTTEETRVNTDELLNRIIGPCLILATSITQLGSRKTLRSNKSDGGSSQKRTFNILS